MWCLQCDVYNVMFRVWCLPVFWHRRCSIIWKETVTVLLSQFNDDDDDEVDDDGDDDDDDDDFVDVQQTLETQREEISSLRSRMLEEYEQLLTTRADVMATQTQEVEKLQREMEELQQSYEEQIKVFQTKVEEQSGNRAD